MSLAAIKWDPKKKVTVWKINCRSFWSPASTMRYVITSILIFFPICNWGNSPSGENAWVLGRTERKVDDEAPAVASLWRLQGWPTTYTQSVHADIDGHAGPS